MQKLYRSKFVTVSMMECAHIIGKLQTDYVAKHIEILTRYSTCMSSLQMITCGWCTLVKYMCFNVYRRRHFDTVNRCDYIHVMLANVNIWRIYPGNNMHVMFTNDYVISYRGKVYVCHVWRWCNDTATCMSYIVCIYVNYIPVVLHKKIYWVCRHANYLPALLQMMACRVCIKCT